MFVCLLDKGSNWCVPIWCAGKKSLRQNDTNAMKTPYDLGPEFGVENWKMGLMGPHKM